MKQARNQFDFITQLEEQLSNREREYLESRKLYTNTLRQLAKLNLLDQKKNRILITQPQFEVTVAAVSSVGFVTSQARAHQAQLQHWKQCVESQSLCFKQEIARLEEELSETLSQNRKLLAEQKQQQLLRQKKDARMVQLHNQLQRVLVQNSKLAEMNERLALNLQQLQNYIQGQNQVIQEDPDLNDFQ